MKALGYALHYLAARKRSEKEIFIKLRDKGYDEEVIEATLLELKELGLIDDQDFAQSLINDRRNFKKSGKRLLVQELKVKGIDAQVIEKVVGLSVTDESEFDNALSLAVKKSQNLSGEDDRANKNKLYQFLLRKGYSPNIIARVLRQLASGGTEQ